MNKFDLELELQNVDLEDLREKLVVGHYEYQAFNKSYRTQLRFFTFVFSLLITLNIYNVMSAFNNGKKTSIIANVFLIIFNTVMATTSFNKIALEKLKSISEDKDFKLLLIHMDKFIEKEKEERENE